jgi:hypothetical protein
MAPTSLSEPTVHAPPRHCAAGQPALSWRKMRGRQEPPCQLEASPGQLEHPSQYRQAW